MKIFPSNSNKGTSDISQNDRRLNNIEFAIKIAIIIIVAILVQVLGNLLF